jgi:hypothetical protein
MTQRMLAHPEIFGAGFDIHQSLLHAGHML